MSLFFLDKDPHKCAQYHCDAHINQLITEVPKIISNALHFHINNEITKAQNHKEHLKECENCARIFEEEGVDLDEQVNILLEIKSTLSPSFDIEDKHIANWAGENDYAFMWMCKFSASVFDQQQKRSGRINEDARRVLIDLLQLVEKGVAPYEHPNTVKLVQGNDLKKYVQDQRSLYKKIKNINWSNGKPEWKQTKIEKIINKWKPKKKLDHSA